MHTQHLIKNKTITPDEPNSVQYHIPYKSNYEQKELAHITEILNWLKNPIPNDYYHKRAYYHDFYRSVEADIHNLRSKKTPEAQNILHQFAILLKQTKTKSIKELVVLSQNKAYEIFKNK